MRACCVCVAPNDCGHGLTKNVSCRAHSRHVFEQEQSERYHPNDDWFHDIVGCVNVECVNKKKVNTNLVADISFCSFSTWLASPSERLILSTNNMSGTIPSELGLLQSLSE